MSIYSAMNVGVAGLQAQSNAISIISDNIANSDTVGYKEGSGVFETLVASSLPDDYSPGGVEGGNEQLISGQGEINNTSSPTDLAISGNGFFAVSATPSDPTQILYTRSGSFTQDANGDFVNSSGYFLQGWQLDASGNLPSAVTAPNLSEATAIANLTTVNVQKITEPPVATANVSLVANLDSTTTAYAPPPPYDASSSTNDMASGAVTPDTTQNVQITDSLGNTHNLTIGYLKTSTNTWAVEVYANPPGDVTAAGGQLASGTLTLNTDGSLASVSSSLTSIPIAWTNGANPSTLTENWSANVQPFNPAQAIYSGTPAYSASSSASDMASGTVTPDFTKSVSITDSNNVTHTLTIGYLRTSTNIWSVEVYANPPSDVTAAGGQLASGTLTLNNDGSLASVSSGLSSIPISWTNGANASTLNENWQTDVQPLDPGTAIYNPPPIYDATNNTANMASGSIQPDFDTQATVIDSQGDSHVLDVQYLKTANNTWQVEVVAQPASDVTATDGQVASGTITFNGDGSLATVSAGLSQAIPITWNSGATASSITFNWGTAGAPFGTPGAVTIGRTDGLSQLASDNNLGKITQDGVTGGTLTKLAIDQNGNVIGTFSDGNTRNLYKIPVVSFIGADQLQGTAGNAYLQTADSGTANFDQAGQAGVGTLDPSALEASTVDINTQLISMIVAQRAYDANSKTISTNDEMLQTLTQLLT